MRKKLALFMTVVFLAAGVIVPLALGADYPNRTVELYIPYTPGGTTDILGRLIAEIAQKHLGQPLVAVNKPGGGGSVAAATVLSSKPDGYKVVMLATNFFGGTIFTQKLPFDADDLVPIANFIQFKEALAVRNDCPWKTLADMLDYGKNKPGELKWGHPAGRGSPLFMNMVLILKKAGVTGIEVPYQGSGVQLTSLLGGHIDVASTSFGAVRESVNAGKLRYLASYGPKRYGETPNLPTAAELGFTDVGKLNGFVGLYVHKDTPPECKKALFNALKKTFDDPEFQKKLEAFGEEPLFAGPEFIIGEIKTFRQVAIPMLKEFGLYEGK
jgi:tripartite-type tricarboxylate transporter receptor subunit TctC